VLTRCSLSPTPHRLRSWGAAKTPTNSVAASLSQDDTGRGLHSSNPQHNLSRF